MNTRQHLTHRRTAQVVIWLLAALMAAFVAVAGPDITPAADPGASSAPAGPVYAAEDTGTGGGTFTNDDEFFTMVEGLDADQAREFAAEGDRDTGQWLPAYRWQNSFQIQSQPDGGWSGAQNFDEKLTAGLSSLLFVLAGFLWTLTLGLTKWAFTTDLVEMLGTKINVAASGLAGSFGSSGLIAIVVLMLLVSVALSMFRGGKKGAGPQAAIRNVAMFVVPIAAMQLMTANPNATEGDQGYSVSPVGLADRGSEVINDIVFQVTTPLTASPLSAPAEEAEDQPPGPNCEYYYGRLYGTYHNMVSFENDKHEAALVLVSRMWEATMLRSFTEAQYGNYDEGRYAVCHQLETQRGVSTEEQAALANGPNTPYAGMKLDRDQNVFGRASEDKHQYGYYFAWMACREKAWDAVWEDAAKEDRLESGDCEGWWENGFSDEDGGRFASGDRGNDALTFEDDGDEGPAAKLGGTDTMEYEVVSTFMEGDGRFFLAAASVITAAAYLVALGGLAIGTIVATVLLALLLVFSPVMLLLLALPSSKGERNEIGKRMLRMTGTTMLAKLTFYLSITVMVILINLLNGLVV